MRPFFPFFTQSECAGLTYDVIKPVRCALNVTRTDQASVSRSHFSRSRGLDFHPTTPPVLHPASRTRPSRLAAQRVGTTRSSVDSHHRTPARLIHNNDVVPVATTYLPYREGNHRHTKRLNSSSAEEERSTSTCDPISRKQNHRHHKKDGGRHHFELSG